MSPKNPLHRLSMPDEDQTPGPINSGLLAVWVQDILIAVRSLETDDGYKVRLSVARMEELFRAVITAEVEMTQVFDPAADRLMRQ